MAFNTRSGRRGFELDHYSGFYFSFMSLITNRPGLRDKKPYVIGHMNEIFSQRKTKLRLRYSERVACEVAVLIRTTDPFPVDVLEYLLTS